jgi:hypothetical protein
MNKTGFLLIVLTVSLCATSQASAAVLTFDDVGVHGTVIPNGYGGFNWSNIRVADRTSVPGGGYGNGTISGNFTAYNTLGNPAALSGPVFTFNGAYFTAAFNNGLTIQLLGLLGGTTLFSQSVVVDTTGPTWAQLDWVGIDALSFTSSGGVNYGLGGGGTQFVMDNFTFNEPIAPVVPEPGTLALMIGGGVAVAGAARRRQRPREAMGGR